MPPTTVNATFGTVTVTAVTPAFAMKDWKRTLVSAGSGTVTVTGFAASIIAPVIAATLGTVTVTAYPAEIHQARIDVLCNTGTVTVTGYNVDPFMYGVLVNATLGQVTVTGYDAVSTFPTVVKVTQAGAVTVTGYDTIVNSTAVWASLGQVLVTGYNPEVVAPLIPGFGVGPAPSTSKDYVTYYQDWATHFPAEIARRWRQFLLDTFYIATPPTTAGGSANSIELTTDDEITMLSVGQSLRFTALYSNTGGTVLDVNDIGPQYVRYEGNPLTGGEIVAGGIYTVVYDGFYWNLTAASSGAKSAWLDTTDFDNILSAADNDTQKALDTLDDHNHDADYFPATVGGGPVAGHLPMLASLFVTPPYWSLVDSGYAPGDFFIIADEAVKEFAIADALPIKELTYNAGILDVIYLYDSTPTLLYTKTFNYTGSDLTSITLKRQSDAETWTKTLTYGGGLLTDIEVTT